jgi:hypothetical protein
MTKQTRGPADANVGKVVTPSNRSNSAKGGGTVARYAAEDAKQKMEVSGGAKTPKNSGR